MSDVREVLDQLDALRLPAWRGDLRVGQHYNIHLYADNEPVGTTLRPADAALIVAAVNALPGLVAALRAVLDLADDLSVKCPPGDWGSGGIEDAIMADTGRGFRRAITAALSAPAGGAE